MNRKSYFVALFLSFTYFGCFENESYLERNVSLNSYLFSHQIQDSFALGSFSNQTAASSSCDIGNHLNALMYWDKHSHESNFVFPKRSLNGIALKEKIVNKSRKYDCLIFNEQHHNSLHRITLESLLEDLYNEGFVNLGIEHLANDTTLNERGYPLASSTKFYKDPQLYNLIRTALNIGYHVFPYDHDCDNSGYMRELCQVENIMEEVKSALGKTIVFCGYDHGVKGVHESWGYAMAGILKQAIGKDVLTINQTYLSEHSKLGFTSPIYQSIECNKSIVISDQDSLLSKQLERYLDPFDLYIYHPMSKYVNGRPSWVRRKGYKKIELQLPSSLKFPCMVYAFNSNEKHIDAAPLDVIEVFGRKEPVILFVGEYNNNIDYVALDSSGKTFTLKLL